MEGLLLLLSVFILLSFTRKLEKSEGLNISFPKVVSLNSLLAQLPLTLRFWCWNLTHFFSSTTPDTRLREQKEAEWAATKEDVLSLQRSPTTTSLFPPVPWEGASATSLWGAYPSSEGQWGGSSPSALLLERSSAQAPWLKHPQEKLFLQKLRRHILGLLSWPAQATEPGDSKQYGNDPVDFRTLLHKTQWILDQMNRWENTVFPSSTIEILLLVKEMFFSLPLVAVYYPAAEAHSPCPKQGCQPTHPCSPETTDQAGRAVSIILLHPTERYLQCCKILQWWELTSCLKVLQNS